MFAAEPTFTRICCIFDCDPFSLHIYFYTQHIKVGKRKTRAIGQQSDAFGNKN